jgi:HK97 family phage prohead protease
MQLEYVYAGLVTTKAPDDGQKLYTFKASADSLDRDGEIVSADGWQLDNYRRNPVVVDSHNYQSIENIVGRAVEVREVADGLEADIVFSGTPRGQLAAMLADEGNLRAVSVGFRPLKAATRGANAPTTYTHKDLMEISIVAVPANPDALRLRSLSGKADDIEPDAPVAKAGRVLSAKNEGRLRDALTLLTEVLDGLTSAEADEPEPAKAMDEDRLAALLGVVATKLGSR